MGWGNAAGTREGDGYIPKHKLIMALFSTWYSGDGPMPQDGQGPGQLGRGGVPLPFHFAFLSFPPFSCPQQSFVMKPMKGPLLGSFPHSPTMQPAPPWHWQREAGCQAQPLPLRGPLVSCLCCESGKQGRAGLRRGIGMCFYYALLSPEVDISIFHNHTHIIYVYIHILYTLTFFFSILIYCLYF